MKVLEILREAGELLSWGSKKLQWTLQWSALQQMVAKIVRVLLRFGTEIFYLMVIIIFIYAGVEHPCRVLYRTEHWNIPDYIPWGVPLAYLYLNRFSELMVHKPGEGFLLSLLAAILAPLVNFPLIYTIEIVFLVD